jgi:prepilin-type N-terminal cleavage/methylation domain-containing protein
LIEVLTVILILGILAAFAYPAFSSWIPSYSLRRAAKDLYSNLHLAKGGAIKTNRPWAVIFDPGEKPGRYFICSDDKGNGWDGPPEMGGDDRLEMTVRLADYKGDVDFGHGLTPRLGYVYISNSKGQSWAVGTPANAGVINVRQWSHGAWRE